MAERMCILLVDDNPADLELARIAFADHDDWVGVTSRDSGSSALAYLRNPDFGLPDVVVLDVNMPGMSGFEVLQAIKDDPILQHIPVVMLSTSSAEADVAQAYTLHASSYLIKEEAFQQFVEQIDDFVRYWRRCCLAHAPHR